MSPTADEPSSPREAPEIQAAGHLVEAWMDVLLVGVPATGWIGKDHLGTVHTAGLERPAPDRAWDLLVAAATPLGWPPAARRGIETLRSGGLAVLVAATAEPTPSEVLPGLHPLADGDLPERLRLFRREDGGRGDLVGLRRLLGALEAFPARLEDLVRRREEADELVEGTRETVWELARLECEQWRRQLVSEEAQKAHAPSPRLGGRPLDEVLLRLRHERALSAEMWRPLAEGDGLAPDRVDQLMRTLRRWHGHEQQTLQRLEGHAREAS